MTDSASSEPPIAIDRVERARGQGDDVRLRLSGRWLTGDSSSQSWDALTLGGDLVHAIW